MQAIEDLYREATKCRQCFADGRLKAGAIDIAQPRWIAPGYWTAPRRVVYAALNPGGKKRSARFSMKDQQALIAAFSRGETTIEPFFADQRRKLPTWNDGRLQGFLDQVGLDLDQIALANIALCSVDANQYEPLLRPCFQRHTRRVFGLLKPDVVILAGVGAHRFGTLIRRDTGARVIKTYHFAAWSVNWPSAWARVREQLGHG